jgi:hypothetical protein
MRTRVRPRRLISRGALKRLKSTHSEQLIRLPTALVVDDFAFALSPRGWHYFRALLADYERNQAVRLEDTAFWQFFQHDRIRGVRYLHELLFVHDSRRLLEQDGFRFYLGTYPWGDWTAADSVLGGKPFGYHYDKIEGAFTRDLYGYRRNPWYSPGERHALEIEWRHTLTLYRSLKHGYTPVRHGSFPSVVLLVRTDGTIRAVRYEGHHRLCILAHLGAENLTVAIRPESVRVVDEAEVEQWYYVARGLCTAEQALEIFNAYFELDGRERAEFLGVGGSY